MKTLFATTICNDRDYSAASMLVDSVREFGGPLKSCPFWAYYFRKRGELIAKPSGLDLKMVPAAVPEETAGYELADKVHACAEAERNAPTHVESLV